MSHTTLLGALREVELHRIDPPELAMRESFNEEKLMELADSIKANGLISPLLLRPRGDRFEIIAGHRRYTALRMLDALTAPAIVAEGADVDFEAWKVAENADREDVNPAHEAKYFDALLNLRCDNDTDILARLVGRSREYVESRLLLLKGDPRVLDAIAQEKISLSVAKELNAIHDANLRAVYVEAAIRGGCSGRQAREWRLQANGFSERQTESATEAGAAAPLPTQPADSIFRCICCNGDDDLHLMKLVYVHDGCLRAVLRPLLGHASPASS